MDQKAKWQNMNSNFEENRNVKQKLYESSNMGIVLKLRSLRTKEWPTRHWVSLIKIGVRNKFRLGVCKNTLVTKGDLQWGEFNLMYTQVKRLSMFSSAIHSLRTLGREKYRGRIIGGGPWNFFEFRIYEHMEEWLQHTHKISICVLVSTTRVP